MDRDSFRAERMAWFDRLLDKALTPRVLRIAASDPRSAELSRSVLGLMVMHVGIGHLLGYEDEDQSIPDAFPSNVVVDVVSHVWRAGEVDPALVLHLTHTWITYYCLGRDTGSIDEAILETVLDSPVGRWVQSMTAWDLSPAPPSADFEDSACKLRLLEADERSELLGPTSKIFDFEGSHIWTVQTLLALEELSLDSRALTLLELVASFPDSEEDNARAADIALARKAQIVAQSIPGSWPSTSTRHVPEWVEQVVLQFGARFWDGTTGLVPNWLIVVESKEELRSLQSWLYKPRIGMPEAAAADAVEFSIPFTFESGETGHAWIRYPNSDLLSQIHLRTLLAVRFLRLDVYRITAESELVFEWSAGMPFPDELAEQLTVDLPAITPDSRFDVGVARGTESLLQMAMRDGHNFELVQRCQEAYWQDPEGELASAYRRFLNVAHAAALARFRGSIADDEVLEEAYESLRTEMSRVPTRALPPPLDARVLGPQRIYLQFRTTAGDQFLEAFSAYRRSDGVVIDERWDLSASVRIDSLSADPAICVDQLVAGFRELSVLLSQGVKHAVVSLDQATYGLPVHQALINLGFEEVSYAHTLSSLSSPVDWSSRDTAIVEGWAGRDGEHIEAVTTELAAVRTLYRDSDAASAHEPVDVVHLSGHAQTGTSYADVCIASSPSGVTSSASVLRDFDETASLVVLAACGTGIVDFGGRRLLATPPLDVAFIEAGAGAVISTAAPVNDTIAGVFSITFHHAYSSGSSIWGAYAVARGAARGDSLPPGTAEWLQSVWPTWVADRERALREASAHWILFRVSGRHWEV